MSTLVMLLTWMMVASSPAVAPAATAPVEAPALGPAVASPGSDLRFDPLADHINQMIPYEMAPGRPYWAPLELTWGDLQYRSALERILREGTAEERSRAALGLALIGATDSREALAAALRANEGAAKQWAGIALCYLGDPRGVTEAQRALNLAPVWTRFYALVGLWRLNSPKVRDFIAHSEDGQGPFLQTVMPQALQSACWQPPSCPPVPVEGARALSAYELWEALADQLLVVSDFWWHCGDYDHCSQSMEAALFFSPKRVGVYDDVAWLQWSLGRDPVALDTLNRCLEVNPDSWQASFNLGYHYFNTKRFAQALPYLQTAAKASCDTWIPAHICAHDLEQLKRPGEALAVWEDCLKRFPDDAIGQRNLDHCRACQAPPQ